MSLRISLPALALAITVAACHSTSSSDAAGSASAAPTVSSWPVLPADPVDAMTAADEDPVIVAYGRKANDTLRFKFRDCINSDVQKNSKLAGSVTMVANVNADGTVASVTPVDLQGFDAASIKCLTKAISTAHFPLPPADHTIIKMPFVLTHG